MDFSETKWRPLTMGEIRKLRAMGDEDEADWTAVAWSGQVLPAEAKAWFDQAPAGDVVHALEGIFEASGLRQDAQFRS